VDLLRTPAFRFLGYLQDHDQIGNRAVGDRISAHLPASLVKVGAGLVLTAPFTPMLFMGEEWAAATPWQYFTDHTDPALATGLPGGGAPPPTPPRRGPGRRPGAAGPSSPRPAGPPPTCPTRKMRPRSCAPSWTGPSWASRPTRRSWPGTRS